MVQLQIQQCAFGERESEAGGLTVVESAVKLRWTQWPRVLGRFDRDGHEWATAKLSVVVGEAEIDPKIAMKNRYHVSRTVPHHRFQKANRSFDIMLLQLTTSIEFNDRVAAIVIDQTVLPAASFCCATEWTRNYTDRLYISFADQLSPCVRRDDAI